ncbi:MAG: agmatinase [Acidobacteriota bacterium]
MSTQAPFNFLGLPGADTDLSRARAVILPVPYERTTSYAAGTARGPEAIIEASRYVELYDEELETEPYRVGVHTAAPLDLTGLDGPSSLSRIQETVQRFLERGKWVCMLGGEHTITTGGVRAALERHPSLTVVQLDAHADLRDQYEDSPWSHACVMRRVHDLCPAVAIGIRALSLEEAQFARAHDKRIVYAHQMEPDWPERVLEGIGGDVYLTFDLDFLDPSIMPATGTPEPGGGVYGPTLRFLRGLTRRARVVAMDLVELMPLRGLHAPNFVAARLAYKILGYCFSGTGAR